MFTRFGDQPLIGVMKEQRWSYTALARKLDLTFGQLYCAARGVVVPSPTLRDKLPKFFGVPLDRLFTAEALAAEFGQHGPKPKERAQ